MTQQEVGRPGGLSPGWRRFWTILLGVLFVVIFLAFVAGIVVRRDILDAQLYTDVLNRTDAYERVYRDVLADPALQQSLADALGIDSNLISGEIYAELVSGLNLVLPPPKMEQVTEGFLGRLTGYLAGDTPELQPNLDFGQNLAPDLLADRIVSTVQAAAVKVGAPVVNAAEARAAAAATPAATVFDESAFDAYIQKLRTGALAVIPPELKQTAVTKVEPEVEERVRTELFALPAVQENEAAQIQIDAALAEDDVVGAITLASRAVLRGRIADGLTQWEANLAASKALNGISSAALALGQTEAQVLGTLNLVRGYANLVKNLLIPLAILLAVLLGVIAWLNSNDLRAMLRSTGWTLVIAGGLAMVLVWGGGLWLRGTLESALAGQPLPAGADRLVDDLVVGLSSAILNSVWGVALFWFVVGVIALVFGYSSSLINWLRRVMTPLWPYRAWIFGGLFALLVVAPLLIRLFTAPARAANLPCNGHAELCDRPVNEIAYPTTHNSMSISQYGWLWPSHDGTVRDQLDAGVRALLIDTHYWDTAAKVEEAFAEMSPEMRAVAEKALDKVGIQNREGTFFCHMACFLGSTAMADTLADVRSFLEENPREVLFIVIQDDISPADTEATFKDAGLDKFLFTHKPGEPWPTLRQMIDANERLVVMAEENGPPPDWYQNVWDNTMETPYTFINYDDFSCAVNRGGDDKPFFLLNHWIQRGSPNRVDASIVNEYEFLLARARQCADERGKLPNFVAVNFFQNGDLFRVVDELNGVSQPVQQ